MSLPLLFLALEIFSPTCLGLTTITAPPCAISSAAAFSRVLSASLSPGMHFGNSSSTTVILPPKMPASIPAAAASSIHTLVPIPILNTLMTTNTSTITPDASTCTTTPYSGTSSPPNPTLDFQDGFIARHAYLRSFHSSPTLTWNADLAAVASERVNTCTFSHTVNDPYGENLAGMQQTGGYTESQLVVAVDEWYAEISHYDFSNPGFSSSTGHFTQLVWKASAELGCAWKDCSNTPLGLYFIACEYSPPGNLINANGQAFRDNVLQPQAAVSCS